MYDREVHEMLGSKVPNFKEFCYLLGISWFYYMNDMNSMQSTGWYEVIKIQQIWSWEIAIFIFETGGSKFLDFDDA